jgi:uncharacterized phage-associated protein
VFDIQPRVRHGDEAGDASYAVAMTPVSAHAVLAALRARAPGLGVKKAHKLLYYCQGHHLATFGRPLFPERISAWDMGPVVGQVWYAEKNGQTPEQLPALGEAELNTVGYVLSRYGALSGTDLERLTHHEPPWAGADEGRAPGSTVEIAQSAIETFFRSSPFADDDEAPALSAEAVQRLVAGAHDRLAEPATPDDPAALRARVTALRESRDRAG